MATSFSGPCWKVEGPQIARQLVGRHVGIEDDLGEQLRRLLGARTPDDVAAGCRRERPLPDAFCRHASKTGVPLLVGADAERFEIPAVLAVVRSASSPTAPFDPAILAVPQGDGRLAPHAPGRHPSRPWRRRRSRRAFSSRARRSADDADVGIWRRRARRRRSASPCRRSCRAATARAPQARVLVSCGRA